MSVCRVGGKIQEQIPANIMNSYGSTKIQHLLNEVGFMLRLRSVSHSQNLTALFLETYTPMIFEALM